jgi:spore coat polysaccharide biosynthesis protein SpsF (cytidylyltransferase family)
MLKIVAVIQARTGSTRLPKKVLKEINNEAIIRWQIRRIQKVKKLDYIVLATTNNQEDNELASLAEESGIQVFRGDSLDVLSRFQMVINEINPENIVRITGDCPLFMPTMCDTMISDFYESGYDYLSNTIVPTWPDGCDIEIFKTETLLRLQSFDLTQEEREHVTLGIYKRQDVFKCKNYANDKDESEHRWTLDTLEDLHFLKSVYSFFKGKELDFTYNDVMKLFEEKLLAPRIDSGGMRNSSLRKI